MRSHIFVFVTFFVLAIATDINSSQFFIRGLQPLLSEKASITTTTSGAPRWSEFNAPNPAFVVNVATENDVLMTVRYCNANRHPFLAQNGGHGWATTIENLGPNGVIINLRALHAVTFNDNKTVATIQGGTLISDAVAAAAGNNTMIPTGNCDCVGLLGAVLGGGYGHLMGQHGFGVDNILELNVVTAEGQYITITPADADLWWALRGAGPNFGIVTSAKMNAFPSTANATAWLGIQTFTEDKIESLVQAINDLVLEPKMAIFLYYTVFDGEAVVATLPFYHGSEAEGKAAFASIYAVGPTLDLTAVTPYSEWNAGGASFCEEGGRKPSYSASFQNMVPTTWRSIWNEYVAFLSNPGTANSTVLLEAYSLINARKLPDSSSSFPFRSSVNFNAVAIPWYSDSSLDSVAKGFGSKVRDLWRATDGEPSNQTYINFAFGDEKLPVVYGDNVERLRKIKKQYDPFNRFNKWFPL